MTEKREIISHGQCTLQGPHLSLPTGFVPLLLAFEPRQLHVEIMRPTIVVGRHSDADMRLAFPDISRHHCRLLFVNGQWRVCDLKSTNGVYVNHTRTSEATLYAGDLLYIGSVRILVKSATPARFPHPCEPGKQDKLRQIADQLPTDEVRQAS
jgi:pSer/pThr/pTyr-binding forkhead associated (FHA) protein